MVELTAFLDGWSSGSRHEWIIPGLPAHQWKWRMRHSSVTLATVSFPDSNSFILSCNLLAHPTPISVPLAKQA